MSRQRRVNARPVLAALKRAGFQELPGKATGHRQLRRSDGSGRVTVPVHGGEAISPKILASILRQASLTAEEFQALL